MTKHYPELQRKYSKQYVVVKDGRVAVHGRDFGRVYRKALREVKKDFVTGYILPSEPFVLYALIQGFTDRV